jgi:hypothetical protein
MLPEGVSGKTSGDTPRGTGIRERRVCARENKIPPTPQLKIQFIILIITLTITRSLDNDYHRL